MSGQTRHNTRQHAQFPPSFLDMDACTTSQLNVVLVRKLLCAWPFFDTLSIGVCTTRHWQMSGQLVQELNVCTVQFLSCTLDIYGCVWYQAKKSNSFEQTVCKNEYNRFYSVRIVS